MTSALHHHPLTRCHACGAHFHVHPYRILTARACSKVCAQVLAGRASAARRYRNHTRQAPYAKRGGVRLHRAVMAAHLGRALRPDEIVHHVNGNKHDNRPRNLRIVTVEQHARLHGVASGRPRRATR